MNPGKRFGVYPHHDADAKQFADWGFDYLKYDWNPLDVPHTRAMYEALRTTGRDVVLSLSNTGLLKEASLFAPLCQAQRTTGDIVDTWDSMSQIGFDQDGWGPFARPGYWNDPDMLVVGHVGWGAKTHPTRLLPSEQYSHISLWALLSAPLLIGCDLDKLDAFTLNLLTNDEVLAINQDPLGQQARRLFTDGLVQVWAKKLEDATTAFGVFNLAEGETTYQLDLTKLTTSLAGKTKVRDAWRQTDIKLPKGTTTLPIPLKAHGCGLYVI